MKNLFLLYLLVGSLDLDNKMDISPIKGHGLIHGGHINRAIIKSRTSWSYKRGVLCMWESLYTRFYDMYVKLRAN